MRALSGMLGTPVTYVAGEEASNSLPRAGDLFADPAHDLARTISRAGVRGRLQGAFVRPGR